MPDKTSSPKKTSIAGAAGEAAVLADLKTRGCTNLRLRQLVRRVDQHYDLEMAKAGLKTTQYSLLTYVLRFGPLRPGNSRRASSSRRRRCRVTSNRSSMPAGLNSRPAPTRAAAWSA
jgi:hypothetical protein